MSASYQRMIFVCLNDRGEGNPKGSCGRSGGAEVLERLRADLHERGLKRVVRAVGTRCLGQCSRGPVACVQPEDVWYGGIQAEDVEEVIETHVLGGRSVERLELDADQLTGISETDHPLPRFERGD